ncbi:MAG TPA: DegT/DnrJ/EryC1/StrS family aminotransferase [bacterium]|nr:DegT/DnrJ/EryC1/StrS family aminotransferase [bacterium]
MPTVLTQVPFVDLARQHAEQQGALEAALLAAFRAGAYCNGPTVHRFETLAADYLGEGVSCIATSSGTDALLLAIQALGLELGQEVITPTFSFFASASAINLAGGTPRFADIDPGTYCVTPSTLEAAWSPQVRGAIVVHLYGHPAPMPEILEWARSRGCWVLEDCAQAFGARLAGRRAGTFGEAAAVSFYPTKNLNACGDAGMIVARDPEVAERMRLLRTHGERPRYTHTMLGRNARMDDLQAAILETKLPRLDHWNARRREIALEYSSAFAGLPIQLPPGPRGGIEPIFHQYTIATDRRDALRDHLAARGIGCGVYYPVPLHEQPLYERLGYPPQALPVAHRLSREVLSLPIFPQLREEEIAAVIDGVRSFYG